MYAACIGEVDGIRLLGRRAGQAGHHPAHPGPNIVLLDMDIQFGLGFMVPSTMIELGGPQSFGHFGAGGSVGWADPDAELAFGYVMNRMDIGLAGDLRSADLINACYAVDLSHGHGAGLVPAQPGCGASRRGSTLVEAG